MCRHTRKYTYTLMHVYMCGCVFVYIYIWEVWWQEVAGGRRCAGESGIISGDFHEIDQE